MRRNTFSVRNAVSTHCIITAWKSITIWFGKFPEEICLQIPNVVIAIFPLQKDGKTMLKINHAEGLIDEMLTIKPNIIVTWNL